MGMKRLPRGDDVSRKVSLGEQPTYKREKYESEIRKDDESKKR